MPRRQHNDDEFLPSSAVLRALNQWLLKNNVNRRDFGEILGVLPAQVSRLFNRNSYLSQEHREIIEELTNGDITNEMLVGEEPPPEVKDTNKSIEEDIEREVEKAKESIKETADAEDCFDELVKKQVLEALIVVSKLMKTSKNDTVRFKCAEKIIDYAIGRPLRAEKKTKQEKEENDSELYDKLLLIAERIHESKQCEPNSEPSSETGP